MQEFLQNTRRSDTVRVMSPVRFERHEDIQGTKRTTTQENPEGFELGFSDVKLALGVSSEELKQLSDQFNVPRQQRIRGPEGEIYHYSDEHLLRMALQTNNVMIESDEDSGLIVLVRNDTRTTLSIPLERLGEFTSQ